MYKHLFLFYIMHKIFILNVVNNNIWILLLLLHIIKCFRDMLIIYQNYIFCRKGIATSVGSNRGSRNIKHDSANNVRGVARLYLSASYQV